MTIFQDPRASALVDKIQAIHDARFDKPLAPVSEQSIFKAAFKSGKICRETFMKIFNEMVEAKAQEVQVLLADQIRENISGIEWYTVEYGNISVKLPRLHSDLKLVLGDKEILVQSKDTALEFMLHWNQSFNLWHYDKESDYPWRKTVWTEFYTQYLNSEWLEVTVDDSIFDVRLFDGTLEERPTFAISAYCYKDIEPSKNHLLFQWNNSTPDF